MKTKEVKAVLEQFVSLEKFNPFGYVLIGYSSIGSDAEFLSFKRRIESIDSVPIFQVYRKLKELLENEDCKFNASELMLELECYKVFALEYRDHGQLLFDHPFYQKLDVAFALEKTPLLIQRTVHYYQTLSGMLSLTQQVLNEHTSKCSSKGTGSANLSLEFMGSQRRVLCYLLLAEQLGLFRAPSVTKPINRILQGCKFYSDGELKEPGDIISDLSRIRKGRENGTIKALNGRFKREILASLKTLYNELSDENISIYDKV